MRRGERTKSKWTKGDEIRFQRVREENLISKKENIKYHVEIVVFKGGTLFTKFISY